MVDGTGRGAATGRDLARPRQGRCRVEVERVGGDAAEETARAVVHVGHRSEIMCRMIGAAEEFGWTRAIVVVGEWVEHRQGGIGAAADGARAVVQNRE